MVSVLWTVIHHHWRALSCHEVDSTCMWMLQNERSPNTLKNYGNVCPLWKNGSLWRFSALQLQLGYQMQPATLLVQSRLMLLATGSQTKHKQILDRTEGREFLTANGGIEAKVKNKRSIDAALRSKSLIMQDKVFDRTKCALMAHV